MKKLLMLSYGISLLLFTIFSYTFIDPNLSYLRDIYTGFSFSNRLASAIFYISFISIFFAFYGIFIWCGVKKKLNMKDIYILLGITIGILIFSYPAMLSYDVFNYVATAKTLFHYHENPYIVMPIEFLGDPLLSFTHAANKIALYGPFWILLTGIPYSLGIGNFIVTLFSLKLFIAIFYLATIFLIWKMSKNVLSVLLFAFNPLIVVETLMSGHNDIVMLFLALFSYLLLAKRRVFFAVIFLVLSILIKYSTLLLIPIFLYACWTRLKKREIDWKNIYYFSALFMLVGFLLSPIREEIYPWYAIWFISFAFLALDRKILLYTSIAFSLSLLLRYVPFMLTGTYASQTPAMKEIFTFIPPALVLIYYGVKKKV
jgi:hypothetical protein